MQITFEKAQLIRELRREGVTVMQICRDFNVGESTVYRIINGITHRRPPATEKVAPVKGAFQEGQRITSLIDHFAANGDDKPLPAFVDDTSSEEDIARMLAAARKEIGK